jgi:hypothetical protein
MIQTEKISWQSRLRVAKELFLYGQNKEAKAFLFNIDLSDSLSKTGDVTFLTKFTEIILEVLRLGFFDDAKKLTTKITIAKYITTDIPPFLLLRLRFFDHVLLDGQSYEKQINDIIKDPNCPSVCSVLGAYPSFLLRKAELTLERSEERKAIKWISDNVLREYNTISQKSDIIKTVRWLVLDRRVAKAVEIMDQHYHANPSYTDGYTFLSIFIWISGDIYIARNCLSKEIFRSCEIPVILFARAVAVGVIEDAKKAVDILTKIYRIDNNFFIGSDEPTIWGMFSLILRAFGQKVLSLKALRLAEKTDPLHKYRSDLWRRFPLGSEILPIPSFVMPVDFYF